MIRFQMVVGGRVEIDRGFDHFTHLVEDWSPVWEELCDVFIATEKAQFATEGTAEGDKWAPLSGQSTDVVHHTLEQALASLTSSGAQAGAGLGGYAAWKERHFGDLPILQRTGRLYQSLTNRSSPDFVFDYTARRMTIGSTVPYGVFHQFGTRHMAQRKEVQFSEQTKRKFLKVMQMYAANIAGQMGYRRNEPGYYKQMAALRSRYDYLVGAEN
jgi:phage gpG-like protein